MNHALGWFTWAFDGRRLHFHRDRKFSIFPHHTLLPQPHTSNAARVNHALGWFTWAFDGRRLHFRRDRKNSIFLHHTLLPQPNMTNAACVNQPLPTFTKELHCLLYSKFSPYLSATPFDKTSSDQTSWHSDSRHSVTRWSDCLFNILAIYNNENVPISIEIVPKWVHNFAHTK